MRVVAARVHHAHLATLIGRAHARRERQPCLFAERQRVHVRAQRHDRTLRGTAQHRHHARVRHARAHTEAELAELLRHERGGAHLAIAELRVRVQIAPPRDHARLHRARRAVDRVTQLLARRSGSGQHGERTRGGADPDHALSRLEIERHAIGRTDRAGYRRSCAVAAGVCVFDPVRWPREAWVPLASGLAWNVVGVGAGLPWGASALLPGTFLLASGAGMLLYPGDRRLSHFAALGGVLGVLLAPLALAFAGVCALWLAVASAASFLAAGYHALRLDAHPDGVPAPIPTARLAAEVGLDEAMLGTMMFTQRFPSSADHARIEREVALAREQFADAGWLEKPAAYHESPLEACAGDCVRRRTRGFAYEHLSFASEYEPRAGEPGRERWLGYAANRTAHAWVVRKNPDRPWLVCLHGYRMGQPMIDLSAFHPHWLHRHHDFNLLIPVLPLHGPRSIGRSGDGFIGGDLLDTIHAEAQAMWDLRRLLAWVRKGSDAPIGVYGLSLGGYTTALLASLDDRLACAVAGIPAADFARTFYRHGGPWQERAALHAGLSEAKMAEVLRVVSPLALTPKVPHAHRAIFAGVGDRLVPPDQVRDLWRHWGEPRIVWYQGAHLTLGMHPGVRALIDATLRAGLSPAA